MAAHPVGRAPRVFDFPLARLAVLVQIHGAERHGVARSRGEGADAVGLRHGEGRVEEIAVVKVVEREDARLAIVELAHVARVVHAGAVLDRGDGHLLDLVHRQIDVRPVVAVVGVAIEIDGVGFVIGARGVVHEHDVAREVATHEAIVERARGVALGAHGLAVLVAQRPGEFCRGRAEAGGEDAVDGRELARLALLELRVALTGSVGLAQFEPVFAELEGEHTGHFAGVVGVVAFGHHLRGHHAVFAHHVLHTGEGAAVRNGVLEKPLHRLVVHGAGGIVDHRLQEEIGFLQLVVERVVALRKFEFGELALLDHLGAHHVQAREQPAASRRLLVGDAFGGGFVGEIGVGRFGGVVARGQCAHTLGDKGVLQGTGCGGLRHFAAEVFEHFAADGTTLGHGRKGQGGGDAKGG